MHHLRSFSRTNFNVSFPGPEAPPYRRAEALHHLREGSPVRSSVGDEDEGVREVHIHRDAVKGFHGKKTGRGNVFLHTYVNQNLRSD